MAPRVQAAAHHRRVVAVAVDQRGAELAAGALAEVEAVVGAEVEVAVVDGEEAQAAEASQEEEAQSPTACARLGCSGAPR